VGVLNGTGTFCVEDVSSKQLISLRFPRVITYKTQLDHIEPADARDLSSSRENARLLLQSVFSKSRFNRLSHLLYLKS
jgi:hypothetical protein